MNTVDMMVDISSSHISGCISRFQSYGNPIPEHILSLLDIVVEESVSFEPSHECPINDSYRLCAQLVIFKQDSSLKHILLALSLLHIQSVLQIRR